MNDFVLFSIYENSIELFKQIFKTPILSNDLHKLI